MPADSNRLLLGYYRESTFGGGVSGAPSLKTVRCTGESLKPDIQTVVSQELRSDRRKSDVVRVGASVSGGTPIELSYGTYDDWWESTFMSAWSSPVSVGPVSTLTITDTAGVVTINAASGTPFASVSAGMIMKASGFDFDTANGLYVVVSKNSSANLTLIPLTASPDDDASSTGAATSVVFGARVVDGTTFFSYYLEKKFSDLTNVYENYVGMCHEGAQLSLAPGAIVTGQFDWMGKLAASATATQGDGSPDAATTTNVLNAVDNVTALREINSSSTLRTDSKLYDFAKLDWNIKNNLRARQKIGTLGAFSMGVGSVDLGLSAELYLEDTTLYDKGLSNTRTGFAVAMQDAAGNAYVLYVPKVQISGLDRLAGAINTDIMAKMSMTPYLHSTFNFSCSLTRFPAS